MDDEKRDPRYERIKGRLLSIGLAIPGTIRETYLQCGKSWCACSKKGGTLHGPYYFWNRKVNGKLTSKSIPKDKLRVFRAWINNRQEIERLAQQLLEIGQEIATTMAADEPGKKLKKRASAKRGN